MGWIESNDELETHFKTQILMEKMGWNLNETIGALHRVWWWCEKHADDGDLRKCSESMMGRMVGLDKSKGKYFLESMIEAGFIDTAPYLRIHNWWKRAGAFLQKRHSKTPDIWEGIREAYSTIEDHQKDSKTPKKNIDKPLDTDFIGSLKANPAYKGLDIERELSRMDAWLMTKPGRKKTRRFVVNWLNKADVPLLPLPKPKEQTVTYTESSPPPPEWTELIKQVAEKRVVK